MALAIGLMSGTSCDGVSAALVAFRGRTFRLIAERTDPYPRPIPDVLARSRELRTPQLAQLHMLLGELFALTALRLLAKSRVSPRQVAVIGSHGHTVYHGPGDRIPTTLQLGAAAVIAHRLGRPVAADFRARDVAAGGQGAPLIPCFDDHFFGGGPPRALQNLGGIGNVTLVGRRIKPLAFDTGPGNGLLDAAVRRISGGRCRFDRNGRLAGRGRIDRKALAQLMATPFLRQHPPKSTGPELFNASLINAAFGRAWPKHPEDTLATLTWFTAQSIADSYRRFFPTQPREVIVSGGGCLNPTLMGALELALAPIPVRSIADYGLPPQAKEPVAFAFLGWRLLRGEPNHLPSTTGASRRCPLGSITPP